MSGRMLYGQVVSLSESELLKEDYMTSEMIYARDGYNVTFFSLPAHMGSSPERNRQEMLYLIIAGEMLVSAEGRAQEKVCAGQILLAGRGRTYEVSTRKGCIGMEIHLLPESDIHPHLGVWTPLDLKKLLAPENWKILRVDLVSDPRLLFQVMSLGAGARGREYILHNDVILLGVGGSSIICRDTDTFILQEGEHIAFPRGTRIQVSSAGGSTFGVLQLSGNL